MDESGWARRCFRAKEYTQFLQINRVGDVKEIQCAEMAGRDHFCGSTAPEFRFRWKREGSTTLPRLRGHRGECLLPEGAGALTMAVTFWGQRERVSRRRQTFAGR